jgi:hypothetical protein
MTEDQALSSSALANAFRVLRMHGLWRQIPLVFAMLTASFLEGFSGGQLHRIALARALVHRPVLLILDKDQRARSAYRRRRYAQPCTGRPGNSRFWRSPTSRPGWILPIASIASPKALPHRSTAWFHPASGGGGLVPSTSFTMPARIS